MNPVWLAANALLALVQDCLGDRCADYPRTLVDTSSPVVDCATLSVSVGSVRAHSGSCVGRSQLSGSLDVHIVRCCEPVGELSTHSGYTPPTPAEIEAAVACLVRDVWDVYNCIVCEGCEVMGSIEGVTACCDEATSPPDIAWNTPSGGCRGAVIRVPVVFTTCCVPEAPIEPVNCTCPITNPSEDEEVSGDVLLEALCEDANAINYVEFYIDDVLVGTAEFFPWEFLWDSSTVINGSHTVHIVVYYSIGGDPCESTPDVTFTVNN